MGRAAGPLTAGLLGRTAASASHAWLGWSLSPGPRRVTGVAGVARSFTLSGEGRRHGGESHSFRVRQRLRRQDIVGRASGRRWFVTLAIGGSRE
jgi:hypothetical protein